MFEFIFETQSVWDHVNYKTHRILQQELKHKMSSTTTTTQTVTKPVAKSVKHLSLETSTSSLPPHNNAHRPKHISPQDSPSSTKSGPAIATITPSPRHLSPQDSFSRDDPRAYMASLFNHIDGGGDRTRTVVSRSDTVSTSSPTSLALACDARLFHSCK